MLERFVESGKVEFFPNSEYVGDRAVVSHVSGERFEVPERCRIVDAHYLAPSIPAEKPPPFDVAEDARVVPVNDLARLDERPSQYVVVGSGKTATDACIWLLSRGVDPDAICWVRPREPWMMNRAVVQPDPAIFTGMAADTMQAGAESTSLEDLFLRLEDAGIMLRIDRTVMPTMAKAPTLATWELEQLRTLENVVRRGHVEAVGRGKLVFADGSVSVADDALVVHCAADGLKYPPLVPVWRPVASRCRRSGPGSPASARPWSGTSRRPASDDDEKNRLCPPPRYGNSMAEWARMNVRGTQAVMSFIERARHQGVGGPVALNPARIPPGLSGLGSTGRRPRAPGSPPPPGVGKARRAVLKSRGASRRRCVSGSEAPRREVHSSSRGAS